jgi:hypothetical protein
VKNVDEVVHDRIVQHLQRLRSAGLPPGQRRAA